MYNVKTKIHLFVIYVYNKYNGFFLFTTKIYLSDEYKCASLLFKYSSCNKRSNKISFSGVLFQILKTHFQIREIISLFWLTVNAINIFRCLYLQFKEQC